MSLSFEEWSQVILHRDFKRFGELTEHLEGLMVGIPARYIVVLMSFVAISVQYMMRVNISVTIQAMVKPEEAQTTRAISNMCPNNSASSLKILFQGTEPLNSGELEWDESDVGQVLASYFYGYISTQLIAGRASDRWGTRYVCGISLLLTGLLSLVAPIAALKGLPFFIAQRVAIGAVSGILLPSINLLIAKWLTPKERTQLSGLIFSSTFFGNLVGMGVAGLLIGRGHWSVTFYLFGGITVFCFIPWMFLMYDSPRKHPRISEEEKLYILEALGEKENEEKVALPVPWGRLLTSVPMWAAIQFHTGNAWIMYILSCELPRYLVTMENATIQESGTLSALVYLFGWTTGSSFGFLSHYLRDKGLLSHLAAYKLFNGIANLGSAAAILGVTLVGCNEVVVLVLMVVAIVTCSALYGGSCVNHIDLARNFAGTISGVLLTCITVPGILVPLTVEELTEHKHTFTQWNKVFYISAGIAVGTYLVYVVFGSVDEQSWNVPQQRTEQENSNLRAEQARA